MGGGDRHPENAPRDAQKWIVEESNKRKERALYLWLEKTKSDASKEMSDRSLTRNQSDENKYWYSFYSTVRHLADSIYVDDKYKYSEIWDYKWWIVGGVGFLGVSFLIARAL